MIPSVTERLDRNADGSFRYLFSVRNERGADDAIGAWAMLLTPEIVSNTRVLSPRVPGHRFGGSAMQLGPPVIVDQAAIGTMQPGRYLQWFYHDPDGEIAPGTSLDGFGVESPLLPGFTTARFASGKVVRFEQWWPIEIFRQLDVLNGRRWREVYGGVIGPVFSGTESRDVMAKNFLAGIQTWMDSGQVQASSPFITEAVAVLRTLTGTDLNIAAAPATEAEIVLARALEFSLRIKTGTQ